MQYLQFFVVSAVCNEISLKNQQFVVDDNNSDAGSLVSILIHSTFGSVFLIFSAALLWYNERRSAITEYRLVNMRKICKNGECHEIDQELNGELIHMQGQTTTDQILEDNEFGISLASCIQLKRHVEQLQFIKIEFKNRCSPSTYIYELCWRADQICSKGFPSEYQNKPELLLVESSAKINPDVRLGKFKLCEQMKEQCFNFQYLLPDDTQLQAAFKQFGKEFPHIKIKNCEVYLCQFENQSTVGDLRVSFQYVLCGNTTIISKQINNTFVPYVIEDQYQSEKSLHSDEFDSDQGCCTDSWTSKIAQFAKSAEKPIQQLSWITEDIQSSEQLFNQYFIRNSDLTYSTRIKSFSIMVFGITIILEGFFNLGLPRDIQFFIFVGIGMIFSIPVSLIIALLAWMRYHLFYTLINCLGLAIVFSLVALLLGGIFY